MENWYRLKIFKWLKLSCLVCSFFSVVIVWIEKNYDVRLNRKQEKNRIKNRKKVKRKEKKRNFSTSCNLFTFSNSCIVVCVHGWQQWFNRFVIVLCCVSEWVSEVPNEYFVHRRQRSISKKGKPKLARKTRIVVNCLSVNDNSTATAFNAIYRNAGKPHFVNVLGEYMTKCEKRRGKAGMWKE